MKKYFHETIAVCREYINNENKIKEIKVYLREAAQTAFEIENQRKLIGDVDCVNKFD